MNIIKGILSFFFSIVLAMAIFALVILNVANATFLDEEFVLSNLTDNFYTEAYAEIKEVAEDYLEGTNFERNKCRKYNFQRKGKK